MPLDPMDSTGPIRDDLVGSLGDAWLGYASYSRGFKAGGFDTRAIAAVTPGSNVGQPVGAEQEQPGLHAGRAQRRGQGARDVAEPAGLDQFEVAVELLVYGGPAAHIAIMQREFVEQKRWLSRGRFVDLLGLSSLLPGPSSTEVALGIGYERARWPGLLIAAFGFIVPASLIVLAIAIAYGELGSLEWAMSLLYGMSPVVIAVVVHAMVKLTPTACTDTLTWAIGIGSFIVALAVLQPIAILAGAALLLLLCH